MTRVYYWRKDFNGWKVLAMVAGAYHRVHPCQLIKVKKDTVIQGEGSGRNTRYNTKKLGGSCKWQWSWPSN